MFVRTVFYVITLEEIRTEEPTLYLIFPVIVIVISASNWKVQSYEINIVESTMTMSMSMTGKTRYIAPPKVVNFPI